MRLTKKYNETNIYVKPEYEESFEWDERCIDKLGQLEDIEEELGIDFLLLDKICQKGVYCFEESIKNFKSRRYGEISHVQNSDIHIQFFGVYKEKRMGVSIMGYMKSRNSYYTLPMQDYGKTWALTKEELL